MSNGRTPVQIGFERAIDQALVEFKRRLEQQDSFRRLSAMLKQLHEQVKQTEYCHSVEVETLSAIYEDLYQELGSSGRSYENVVDEKVFADTYSTFERFLFDCFYAIYFSFPKYLGDKRKISVSDLFIEGDIELCKRDIVESEVKDFIQANHIIKVIDGFKDKFLNNWDNPVPVVSKNDKEWLFELSQVRHLLIHSNGVVNHIYMEQVKKVLKGQARYSFQEGDKVQNRLPDLVQDIKNISDKVSKQIANALIGKSQQLEGHHQNMSP